MILLSPSTGVQVMIHFTQWLMLNSTEKYEPNILIGKIDQFIARTLIQLTIAEYEYGLL